MSLSANTVVEVRTTGSDTNGGGFVTGASGTDWSQQDSPQYSVTDGVANGTTTLTSASANFGTDVVGNLVYVQGGTGSITAGWYQITSRTSSTAIVVDRSTGLTSGTGVTLKVGGALATPGQAMGIVDGINGTKVWLKSGTYTLTTSSANVAGGKLSMTAGTLLEGYGSTRGDLGTAPVISAGSVAGITIVAMSGSSFYGQVRPGLINVTLNGNSGTSNNGLSDTATYGAYLVKVTAQNCPGTGLTIGAFAFACKASSCGTGFSVTFGKLVACRATGCSGNGITISAGAAIKCIADANTGKGFSIQYTPVMSHCVAHGNTSDGFYTGTYDMNSFDSCVATSNGGYGFANGSYGFSVFTSCAGYGNTSGTFQTTPVRHINPITLTGDPWSNASGGDFRPNNTSGAGAALRAAGMGVADQTDANDVGAVQHADPAGLAGPVIGSPIIRGLGRVA